MRTLSTALLLGASVLGWAPSGHAHVVYERTSLRQWIQQSDAALLARIERGPQVWTALDGHERRDFFEATRLEGLRGAALPARFDFLPHAEGLPAWKPGDRVLLFLERSTEHRELAGAATRFGWVSIQNPRSSWRVPVGDAESAEVVNMARRWAHWLADPDTDLERRSTALRGLLLAELRSPSRRLQLDALSELIRARDQPDLFPDSSAVAPFAELAASRHLAASRRATLGRLLADQPGFDAAAHWQSLLSDLRTDEERRAVLRKLADVDNAGLRTWMQSQLESPNPLLRREAAYALGRLGTQRPIAALATAAADPDPKVARAAIRALGSGSEPEARAALEKIAAGDDPPRANWARAELRRGAAF